MNPKIPFVDLQVVQFMEEKLGAKLVGIAPDSPHDVVWRRRPIDQGDRLSYEFTTSASIRLDANFSLALADALFGSGHRAGQEHLRSQIRQLFGIS